MKRLIIALSIAVALTAFCVGAHFWKASVINNLETQLLNLMEEPDTLSKTERIKKTQSVIDDWDRSINILHALSEHDELSKIEDPINELILCIETNSINMFKHRCLEAANALRHLQETELPNLSNIF